MILLSSAARKGRLDHHGGSSREACTVLVIFSLFSFNLLTEPFLNKYGKKKILFLLVIFI
jgi:hypothetical protein